MANTPQAKKRIRRNERRAEINGARMSRIRTFLKKVESAIEGGDKETAQTALRAAQPELARGGLKREELGRLARKPGELGRARSELELALLERERPEDICCSEGRQCAEPPV